MESVSTKIDIMYYICDVFLQFSYAYYRSLILLPYVRQFLIDSMFDMGKFPLFVDSSRG